MLTIFDTEADVIAYDTRIEVVELELNTKVVAFDRFVSKNVVVALLTPLSYSNLHCCYSFSE